MNKQQFNQFREDFSKISPNIGHSVQSLVFNVKKATEFSTITCGRNSIGKITFCSLFHEPKRLPNYYFEIGQHGVLDHQELDSLHNAILKY